jgi:hypothetical protein
MKITVRCLHGDGVSEDHEMHDALSAELSRLEAKTTDRQQRFHVTVAFSSGKVTVLVPQKIQPPPEWEADGRDQSTKLYRYTLTQQMIGGKKDYAQMVGGEIERLWNGITSAEAEAELKADES